MELPLLHKRKQISLEMIDFQNDDIGLKLELIITGIQKKVIENIYQDGKEVQEGVEVVELEKTIFKRFGLDTAFICNSVNAAVLPFYSNKNHIFIDSIFRGGFSIPKQEKILRTAAGKKGIVNSKNATVSGIFSEYEVPLYINFHVLFKTFQLSVPEVTSIILHELGHAFYACEYSDRLETANQVIQNVAEELNRKKEKADVVYIYREMKSINGKITEEEIDKLINGNRIIAGVTWFRAIVGSVEQQLTNGKYDQTAFEQLADNFASRFKYGRHLMTSLDKMHISYGDLQKNAGSHTVTMILELIPFAILAILSVSFFAINLPLSLLYALVTYLIIRLSGEDVKDYTYDDLKTRYKRIRNEYVSFLKNNNISTEVSKKILEDIYTLDRAIDETFKYNSILTRMSNFIFTSARDAKSSIVEQQLLEELTFSDFVVASAELKNISK